MDSTKEKGMSIFLDVFRRADKNDDSALSWDEFRSYFSDGVLSEEELTDLFHEIDTHNTNNIDTGELCEYFSQHLGPFKDIFCALEDLNHSVSATLSKSAEDYPKSSLVEQFTTRFLLREITNQLGALQRPLDAAADVLDEKSLESSTQTGEETKTQSATAIPGAMETTSAPRDIDAEETDKVTKGSIVPGRIARRARKQFSTQTNWTTEGGAGALGQQVDRLRGLLDRLENRVNFGHVPEEEIIQQDKEELIVVVSRRLHVEEGHEKAFRNSLRNYVEAASQEDSCLTISVRSFTSSPSVSVYEVWKSPEDWQAFNVSAVSKAFRHGNIDNLSMPEQFNSIKLPSSWWTTDN